MVTFKGIELKKYHSRKCVVLELVSPRGKQVEATSTKQDWFESLRGSFQKCQQANPSFLYGSHTLYHPPPPPPNLGSLDTGLSKNHVVHDQWVKDFYVQFKANNVLVF